MIIELRRRGFFRRLLNSGMSISLHIKPIVLLQAVGPAIVTILSSIRLTVCVYCGSQSRCTGLKVVTSCFQDGTSYLLLRIDTFSVGCIVLLSTTQSEKPNCRNFRVWNSHGHVTKAIPDSEISAVRFCRYTICPTQYDRLCQQQLAYIQLILYLVPRFK